MGDKEPEDVELDLDQSTKLEREYEIKRILAHDDYYDVLQVNEKLVKKDIKKGEELLRKAYLKKSLLLDAGRHPVGEKAFLKLARAYDCLSDPETRASYDGEDRFKRRDEPPLLQSLADTLHRMTEEQGLARKRTAFGRMAAGALWLDKVFNKPARTQGHERRTSEEKEMDSFDSQSYQSNESGTEGTGTIPHGPVGSTWKQDDRQIRRVSYSKIDGRTRFQKIAKGLKQVDTVFAAMASIKKESTRRQRERLASREVESDEEDI